MKLFIQIPCYNEEESLPLVLESIPKHIDGVDSINILIIDDGSTDKTIAVAKKHGVTDFVLHSQNRGLARSFSDGIRYCLKNGADIVVNTDGDNQYPQASIPELVRPILEGKAEIVVADRQTNKIAHFSPFKKLLQSLGSRVVNLAAGTNIPDAASGFRAYSRIALQQINVITEFSYCMETIIHAGRKRIPISSVPVKTNPKTRESRLFKNNWEHVRKSGFAIVRSYLMHQPFKILVTSGLLTLVVGLIPFIRYLLIVIINGESAGNHIQSLIAGSVLFIVGVMLIVLGVIADLIKINRILLEDLLEHAKTSKDK